MYKAVITFFLLVGIMIPTLVFSKIDIKWNDIGKKTGFVRTVMQGGEAKNDSSLTNIFQLMTTVINTVLSLLTIIFLATIIYGGLRWMTAQGEDAAIEKAQVAIKAGIIGFVIALSSYAISYFVFSKLISNSSSQTISCQGQANKTDCGDNSVCLNDSCVSECVAQKTGTCMDVSSCTQTQTTGLCPGSASNVCCHSS